MLFSVLCAMVNLSDEVISGGYCGGVPPLPIPNREVKPACADGTAMQCGRVGGRLFSTRVSGESAMTLRKLFFVLLRGLTPPPALPKGRVLAG